MFVNERLLYMVCENEKYVHLLLSPNNSFLFAVKVGNTIGWGVFYDDDCQDDKAEQLCLVFVIFNKSIVDALFVLQPEGGFVPIVLLQPHGKHKFEKKLYKSFFSATKVSIERRDVLTKDEFHKLEGLYKQMLGPAVEIHRKDKEKRGK